MKTVELKNAKDSLASYARSACRDALVITAKGKPVAALVSVEGVDWETLKVSTDPGFIAIIEDARKSIREEGTLSTDELCRELGIRRPKPARPKVSNSKKR